MTWHHTFDADGDLVSSVDDGLEPDPDPVAYAIGLAEELFARQAALEAATEAMSAGSAHDFAAEVTAAVATAAPTEP